MTDDKRSDSESNESESVSATDSTPATEAQSTASKSTDTNAQREQEEVDVWTQASEVHAPNAQTENASSSSQSAPGAENWQQDLINRLAFASLNEQRRARRWGIVFKSFTVLYVGLLFYLMLASPSKWGTPMVGKHTALVDVEGVIAANSDANADQIVTGLRAAFKEKNSAAVIIRINSPGGSPVQAGYVYDEVKRLRKEYPEKKVYAVITDICASGGYYIAASADEVYADKASLVGSIGVLMDGFGFVGTLEKLGIERRLLTAGKHKGIFDPFSPVKKEDVKHLQNMLDGVHKQFINVVKEGRGDRLSDSPDLFTGLFWNGEEGVELGLVDGLGSAGYVAREIVGAEKIVNYTAHTNYLDRFADRLGASIGKVLSLQLGLSNQGLH